MPGSPLTYPFRAAALARSLHIQKRFDVVTTEDPIRAGLAGLLFANRTGVPLNVENHSFHINEPVWLTEKPYHRLYNTIAIRVCRKAASIRNYSPGQSQALINVGVSKDRIHVVPIAAPEMAPVDRAEARRRLQLGPEPLVLTAGRMVTYKNIPLLLDAFEALPESLDARLLLIGMGPARPKWQDWSSRMRAADRITWRDSVPWSDMPLYYSAADVFAAPAMHETGPRTVLEALECGCPVVLTPEMGVVRTGICAHNESALVASPSDTETWRDDLLALITDPGLSSRLVAAGQARLGPDTTMPAIARRLVRVLEHTITAGRNDNGEVNAMRVSARRTNG